VRRDTGLFIIIVYKLLRSALALGASAALFAVTWSRRESELHAFADGLRHQFTSHWSSELADAIVDAVTPRNVLMAAAALALDGTLVLVEGWALWRDRPWGEWIVVIATAALLPFEVSGLWHHPSLGRLSLLLGNLFVALYLLRRVVRPRRAHT
jgi:uncharacterized membrane protein (DUF2068 family)